MTETKPIKLQFAPLDPPTDERGRERTQSAVVEFRNGEYYRQFEAKDAPFEIIGVSHTQPGGDGKDRVVIDITAEDEAAMLVRSGHFVVIDEGESAAKSKVQSPKSKDLGKIVSAPLAASESV